MKRYIRSSWEPKFDGEWSAEDKELWNQIDWKARNYEEYEVSDDTIKSDIVIYGLGRPEHISTTFVKCIRPNPIYPPYYHPLDKHIAKKEFPNARIIGPMYDGNKHDGYDIHDRYETQTLYDQLSI